MKIKIKMLMLFYKVILIVLGSGVVYYFFLGWLNLLCMVSLVKGDVEYRAKSFARADLRRGNYKYYLLTKGDPMRIDEIYSKYEYNEYSITIYYYYYSSHWLSDCFFEFSPKKYDSWFVEEYNSTVREALPEIDWTQFDSNCFPEIK